MESIRTASLQRDIDAEAAAVAASESEVSHRYRI